MFLSFYKKSDRNYLTLLDLGETHFIKKNNKHSLLKNLTYQKNDTIFGKVYVFKRNMNRIYFLEETWIV